MRTDMVTRGVLVRLETLPGKDEEIEAFLRSALALVRRESTTTAWFAARFGHLDYGVFAAFRDEAGRSAHLNGDVLRVLREQINVLIAEPPRIQNADVVAFKPLSPAAVQTLTKGLILSVRAKLGLERDVETLLRDLLPTVQEEADTAAWFALHLNGDYSLLNVFPHNLGRLKHLTGDVPKELLRQTLTLLSGIGDLQVLNVVAAHLSSV